MTGDKWDEWVRHDMLCDERDRVDDWLLPLTGDDVEGENGDGVEDDGDLVIDLWTRLGRELNAYIYSCNRNRKESTQCQS